jgi:hypothetical protein
MTIFKSVDQMATWAKLRLFGNSHIAQATIAVPILGYFILFNADIVNYLRLHSDFCNGGTACGPSWRLYFIYFGCFFVAIGASIYGLRCPTVIKEYSGAANFFESEKVYFSAPSNLKYLFELIEKEKGSPPNDPFELRQHIVDRHAAINLSHTQALAEPMGEYYVLKNLSNLKSRVASFLSYGLGILCLLVPTIITFAQVAVTAITYVKHL